VKERRLQSLFGEGGHALADDYDDDYGGGGGGGGGGRS